MLQSYRPDSFASAATTPRAEGIHVSGHMSSNRVFCARRPTSRADSQPVPIRPCPVKVRASQKMERPRYPPNQTQSVFGFMHIATISARNRAKIERSAPVFSLPKCAKGVTTRITSRLKGYDVSTRSCNRSQRQSENSGVGIKVDLVVRPVKR